MMMVLSEELQNQLQCIREWEGVHWEQWDGGSVV